MYRSKILEIMGAKFVEFCRVCTDTISPTISARVSKLNDDLIPEKYWWAII